MSLCGGVCITECLELVFDFNDSIYTAFRNEFDIFALQDRAPIYGTSTALGQKHPDMGSNWFLQVQMQYSKVIQ